MFIDIKNISIFCKVFGQGFNIQKLVVDKVEDVERISYNLYFVLYIYIIKEDFGKCVDFVDFLIVQGNVFFFILDYQLLISGAGVEKFLLMIIVYNFMRMEVECLCYFFYFCNVIKYLQYL